MRTHSVESFGGNAVVRSPELDDVILEVGLGVCDLLDAGLDLPGLSDVVEDAFEESTDPVASVLGVAAGFAFFLCNEHAGTLAAFAIQWGSDGPSLALWHPAPDVQVPAEGRIELTAFLVLAESMDEVESYAALKEFQ